MAEATQQKTEQQDTKQSDIKQRVKPVLDNVAVQGLKAWLRTLGFAVPSIVTTRGTITDYIVKLIADGQLAEEALEVALIGFEEASDMRIYLLEFDKNEGKAAQKDLEKRLKQFGIPIR